MNRRSFILSLTAGALTGCASVPSLLSGSVALLTLPTAREELERYLYFDELVKLGPELKLWDDTYARALKIVSGNADISAVDAVTQLFGAPDKILALEQAHVAIKASVAAHEAYSVDLLSGIPTEPAPQILIDTNREIEARYKEIKDAVLANDRTVEAVALLRALRPLAIALL